MKIKSGFIVFSVLALCSQLVAAAGDSENATTVKSVSSAPVSATTLVETLFGLLLVLATIAFVAWILRRTNRFTSSANGQLRIIAGLSLGPRERAMLLQVGEQQILVGVTAHQIQTLHVLESPLVDNKAESNNPNFGERLQQILQQRGQS
ncbi:MAG: flagellar biosynthetic protein FliO [Gammaproteobacteria bacterium]|nr:flagellar biosynthetic protein FliO [Gammaproteobacteria bacterium]